MTRYRYLTRDEWGGRWDGTPPVERLPDPETYVHHVGGSAWMGEDAIAVFRQLNDYAQNVKGYQFVDYDLLVHYSRRDDLVTIGEGRGQYRSAATLDRNEEGEAVCVCGNFELREPVAAELEGAALAIVWGVQKGWIARDPKILGHRDNPAHPNATSCPGRHLYSHLDVIRSRVTALLAPPPPPTTGDHVLLYRVMAGDSYWAICRRVHADGKVTADRLAALQTANGMAALKPDDLINIPGRLS